MTMSKLTVSLILSALARAASPEPQCLDASLDRREYTGITENAYGDKTYEGFAVLDLPEYPSINLPLSMAESIPEGVPVNVCVYTSGAELRFYLTRDLEREKLYREQIKKAREQ